MSDRELMERIEAAQARVSVDPVPGKEDHRLVRLDDVHVYDGWEKWSVPFAQRLVVALANDVPDFRAIAVTMESMHEDGPDPHPKASPRLPPKPDEPVHEITHVTWNTEYEFFQFLAECPECEGSGKDWEQLNCEKCDGRGVIEVMGCGREP